MTYIECRQQMHYAEHLARMGIEATAHMRAPIEAAYLSPNCEQKIAQRIHAALDCI